MSKLEKLRSNQDVPEHEMQVNSIFTIPTVVRYLNAAIDKISELEDRIKKLEARSDNEPT